LSPPPSQHSRDKACAALQRVTTRDCPERDAVYYQSATVDERTQRVSDGRASQQTQHHA
jgi:hypothetical protein